MISVNKEFAKDVNKIIFDFTWNGKDKVKRSALISDIEDEGLKAQHLDSVIETLFFVARNWPAINQATGKTFFCIILKHVGGKCIFCCDFDLK